METNLRDSMHSILAISDGRAGNVAMALGLAEEISARASAALTRLDLLGPRWMNALPPGIAVRLPPRILTAALPGTLDEGSLLIGAGRRVAPVLAAAKRRFGVRAVQILDSGLAPSRFDAVVVPQHDGVTGENVLSVIGSVHRVTAARLDVAREQWGPVFGALNGLRIAVLIGGATRRTALKPETVARLAADLAALQSNGAALMITASRRTGEDNIASLRAALPDAWFWDGTGENPYFGMLAWADALIVTDDSVNMASEAASTGAPVAIWPLLEEGGKIARFHASLYDHGAAEPFQGKAPVASKRLNETGRIAQALLRRFDLGAHPS